MKNKNWFASAESHWLLLPSNLRLALTTLFLMLNLFCAQAQDDKEELCQVSNKKAYELAKAGAEAKAKGEKAPNYNLCKVTVPGTNLYCSGNKGIPREDMPQFKGTPVPGSPADKLPKDVNGEADTEALFKEMLQKENVSVSEPTPVSPDRLKATQSELVGVKVAVIS